LRAAVRHEHRPSVLLRILNDAMMEQLLEDRFCTICYVRLRPNPAGARLTLSTGGHPMPIIARASGALESVGRPEMLLGVFQSPRLSDDVVDLSHGDVMVLYTDGLTEAGRGDGVFGEKRLAEVLAGCAGMDAETIAQEIERAVLAHGPAGLRDDLAFIVMRAVATM
jgi:serine phosphatase RsbU (regulator of sigma subunit)